MQSRLGSLVEAFVNVLIGFGINFAMNLVILPKAGLPMPSISQNFEIGLWFTIVSIIRSYAIRRWFNFGIKRFAQWIAGAIKRLSKKIAGAFA